VETTVKVTLKNSNKGFALKKKSVGQTS